MEALGAVSTVEGLLGRLGKLVSDFATKVDQAQNDVATLPFEFEKLESKIEKLRCRVKDVQATKQRSREGPLEQLLNSLHSTVEGYIYKLTLFQEEEQEQRLQRPMKKIRLAMAGRGAARLQELIKEIGERIERDFVRLDLELGSKSFKLLDRVETAMETHFHGLETGLNRLEASMQVSLNRAETSVEMNCEQVVKNVEQVDKHLEVGFHSVEMSMDSLKSILTEGFKMSEQQLIDRTAARNGQLGQQCQGLPDYPVDLDQRAFALEQKFRSLKGGGKVGIYGMGGIGKTTLVKTVFNNMSREFTYTCFIENIKGIPMHQLDDWILAHLHCNGRKVDAMQRINWRDLRSTRVLIVMDDVDSNKQLNVLPRLGDFGTGSLVIFTTRDGSLCARHNPFEVPFLDPEDALKLFCQLAFNADDIPKELQGRLANHVQRVVDKCDRLPLSLEVMGAHLYGHDDDLTFWKGTIDKLGRAQPVNGGKNDGLFATLKISYDSLAPEEKEMFTDVANLFFEKQLDEALATWRSSIRSPETCWANLVSQCLVKGITKKGWLAPHAMLEYQEVWMHEHLRDLGKKLAKTSFLSGSEDQADILIDQIHSNTVKGETKKWRSTVCSSSEKALRLSSFARLKELKYVNFYSVPPLSQQSAQPAFPRKLASLHWTLDSESEADFPSSLQGMNSLAVLELKNWRFSIELMEGLGHHRNLQVLTLRSNSPYHLPESVGRLRQLRRLTLEGEVVSLPAAFGNLSLLEYLNLTDVKLTHLPDSFGSLSSLKTLVFNNLSGLTNLPRSFGSLSSLVNLVFASCWDLVHLPDSFGDLCCLETLVFYNCRELTHMPDSMASMSSLQTLVFDFCMKLHTLPCSFGTNLTSLRDLSIIENWKLKYIPPKFSSLSGLRRLAYRYNGVEKLDSAFQNSTMLHNLQIVSLELQNASLPASFSHLSSQALQSLDLTLKEVPGCAKYSVNFGSADSSSEQQDIDDGDMSANHLLERWWDVSCLQELTTEGKELTTFVECLGRRVFGDRLRLLFEREKGDSRGAQHLLLKEMELRLGPRLGPGMRSLSESIGRLTSLQKLDIEGSEVMELPESFGELTGLHTLKFRSLQNLKMLPESLSQLNALKVFRIWFCGQLEAIPQSMGNLFSLQNVHLWDCGKLETVPRNWGSIAASEIPSDTSDNGQVQRSPEQLSSSFRKEMTLEIEDCPLLDNFLTNMALEPTPGKLVAGDIGM